MMIHFYTKGSAQAGSTRYRVFLTSQELEMQGVPTCIVEPPYISDSSKPLSKRVGTRISYIWKLLLVPRSDVIYLQRTVYNDRFAIFVAVLKMIFRKCLVLDFCDPLFLVPELKPRIHFLMQFVDLVVTADRYSFEYVSRFAREVFYLPMSVPFRLLDKHRAVYRSEENLMIGWIGNGPDHFENLKLVAPALTALAQDGVRFRFKLIGAMGDPRIHDLFAIPNADIVIEDSMDWSIQENIYDAISSFDIGIVPSIDTEWFRVKTFLKPIEMMGIGLPTLISDVGVTSTLIKHGKNGLLVGPTVHDWVNALRFVLSLSAREREDIGTCARETIRENRSLELQAARLATFLKEFSAG